MSRWTLYCTIIFLLLVGWRHDAFADGLSPSKESPRAGDGVDAKRKRVASAMRGTCPPDATGRRGDCARALELRTNLIGGALAPGYVHNRSYWGTQLPGFFVSGRVDVGIYFFRPRISLGYGKAHWSWVGVEANPIFSGEGIGGYGGLRASLPFIDIRVGGRYRWTFRRSYLQPQYAYTREDIEDRQEERSTYLSWEAELTGSLPVGPGNLSTELGLTAITGVEDGMFVYEETLRVVAKPPWVWRALFGYELRFLRQNALRIAAVGQLVGIPGRDFLVVRTGVTVRFRLSYNLELRGTFLPAVSNRDELGLAGGDAYQVGLRYLWAYGPF